jgi:hypothetical protein
MEVMRDRPVLTDVYALDRFKPEPNSAYLYGTSVEERSAHSRIWEQNAISVEFFRVTDQQPNDFEIDIAGTKQRVLLRSQEQLRKLWASLNSRPVYLDITGLAHHVWAALIRVALLEGVHLMVVYVEPLDYRPSPTPTEGEIFDLSEKITGIAPLPGFASLGEAGEEDVCFVPLLGFEGVRLSYLIEQVQPPGGKIVPVVGVPGFRLEYPFYTFHGNRSPLLETRAWKNVRLAKANCPFSLFYLLQDIAESYPRDILKIAPIGTKPHALGAILYALSSPNTVEIVYDHPIRKPTRTAGTARLLVYHVSVLPLSLARKS